MCKHVSVSLCVSVWRLASSARGGTTRTAPPQRHNIQNRLVGDRVCARAHSYIHRRVMCVCVSDSPTRTQMLWRNSSMGLFDKR